MSLTERLFADLTDVTLADEDSNSIPTDDVNRAILGNVAMQVAPLYTQFIVAKLETNSKSANCWPNLQLMPNASSAVWWPRRQPVHVAPPGGQNWNLCK